MTFDERYLASAHEHCFGNEPEVRASEQACCIACARSFPAKLAHEVILQRGWEHPTVACPVCFFDTVIGDRSSFPVDDATFIAAMNRRYQNGPLGSEEGWKDLLNASN